MSNADRVHRTFKESLLKLNAMIMNLDTQLGTVSLSKDEINELNGVKEVHAPLARIDQAKNSKKEEKKNKEIEKKENTEKKTNVNQQKKENDKNDLFDLCDLRVGFVLESKILEGFNDIYSLLIDIGEKEPRIIGTGLRNEIPIEEIQNSKVIVFSNLKPKRFGTTFVSNGMIMCASIKKNEKEIFELIRPNENSKAGDKVYLEGMKLNKDVVPQITGGKYSKAILNFKTDENLVCRFNGRKMITESGNIFVKSLANAIIS